MLYPLYIIINHVSVVAEWLAVRATSISSCNDSFDPVAGLALNTGPNLKTHICLHRFNVL
jgi:hypothetical protein